MSEQSIKFPDAEKVKQTVNMMRESNQKLEVLTIMLDELIAMVEADIRNNPINVYRREKAQKFFDSVKQK